jgi:hypothetical protein
MPTPHTTLLIPSSHQVLYSVHCTVLGILSCLSSCFWIIYFYFSIQKLHGNFFAKTLLLYKKYGIDPFTLFKKKHFKMFSLLYLLFVKIVFLCVRDLYLRQDFFLRPVVLPADSQLTIFMTTDSRYSNIRVIFWICYACSKLNDMYCRNESLPMGVDSRADLQLVQGGHLDIRSADFTGNPLCCASTTWITSDVFTGWVNTCYPK